MTRFLFTDSQSGPEQITEVPDSQGIMGFVDWAWSDPKHLEQWIQEVKAQEETMNLDTQKTIALIGAVAVAVAFVFIVIAPAFPNVIVPQGTANAVYLAAGSVFGWGLNNYTSAQAHAQAIEAMDAGK